MTKYDRAKNIDIFDRDIREHGSYAYTADKLSARLSHQAMNDVVRANYDFKGRSILDLCCGDGFHTLEFAALGPARILGLDLAEAAVQKAAETAAELNLSDRVHFEVGDVYNLDERLKNQRFDCAMFRACLHHLPDPALAIAKMAPYADSLIIVEPNGYNPVVKIIEKLSRYHREHDEKSFTLGRIKVWLGQAGFAIRTATICNLVPCFCPDWMAKLLHALSPAVEAAPLVRALACGQYVIVADRKAAPQ